jgi:GDP-L-fucose synthase
MILVTGATGFLGKRICHLLKKSGKSYKSSSLSLGLDLRDREATLKYFEQNKPDYVLNCAAYVGGIQFGYKHSAELFHNNLQITLNLLEACKESGVKRIVNPISNCSYPGEAKLFKEDEYWNGPLHESVMVYGFVRKASWVGSWAYSQQYNLDVLNLIFSNMYGPEDHFDEERSHALGALIMKFVEAKKNNQPEVVVWGSGKPVREWLHVDDAAEAMVRGLDVEKKLDLVNVGIGQGISIIDMANLIKNYVGYQGLLRLDESKPDGAPFKTVDGSRGEKLFNWIPNKDLEQGIKDTIDWYIKYENYKNSTS